MNRAKTSDVTVAREFFAGELRTLMQKRQVSAHQPAVDYLVDLMLRFMESGNFFDKDAEGKLQNNVLASLYAEYLQSSPEGKKQALKRLGDICLMVTGFFPDSLKRKVVDVDYYFGMGGAAYAKLSETWGVGRQPVFHELSVKFKTFSDLLGEMSERSGLQSNSDLLRLYEKWLYTGSDRIRAILNEKGIGVPMKFDTKTRH